MSPSSACNQLHSRCVNVMVRSLSGSSVASISGIGGAFSRAPMYTQMTPARSVTL